jgi:hypothetical protein
MAMIGKAGGRVTAKRGSNYFARIGRLGGKAGCRGCASSNGTHPGVWLATRTG